MKTLIVLLSTLLNIRFRNGAPLHSIIRERYGQPIVQVVRRLENATIHLEDHIHQSKFLQQCKTYSTTTRYIFGWMFSVTFCQLNFRLYYLYAFSAPDDDYRL